MSSASLCVVSVFLSCLHDLPRKSILSVPLLSSVCLNGYTSNSNCSKYASTFTTVHVQQSFCV